MSEYNPLFPYTVIGQDQSNPDHLVIEVAGTQYSVGCAEVLQHTACEVAVNRGLMDPPAPPEEAVE